MKFVADKLTCLKGKDVLIVDDVVESGNTYRHVREWLAQFEPKSVRTVGLLQVRWALGRRVSNKICRTTALLSNAAQPPVWDRPPSWRDPLFYFCRVKEKMPLVDFVGFTGPTEWFVGYGIDYNDRFREVPHLCVLSDEAKKALAV